MSTDTIAIALIIAFFGAFGVTLFTVALWSQGAPRSRPSVARADEAPPRFDQAA